MSTPDAPQGGQKQRDARRPGRRRASAPKPERGQRRWRSRSLEQVERRRASVPVLRYPQELPVSQKKDEIAAAIRDHQVVIVAGETGSGKTTQIPKICLELGRGVRGVIGHTQPRRLAARTVAERIADERSLNSDFILGYLARLLPQRPDLKVVVTSATIDPGRFAHHFAVNGVDA